MNVDQGAIILIVLTMLGLFAYNRWRYDIVAMFGLIICSVVGLVPFNEVFLGFSHPATITVALVLILSYGLTASGAVDGLTALVSRLKDKPMLHLSSLILSAGFFSMFINNVGALALVLPIAISSTISAKRNPAEVLMPLSFGSILGGLVTMIGTPPNIIIATYREKISGSSFFMFDFAYVGAPVALAGIIFIILLGRRLVKVRKKSTGLELFNVENYIFKVKLNEKSKILGLSTAQFDEVLAKYRVTLITLIHKRKKYTITPLSHIFESNNLLYLEGAQADVDKLISEQKLILLGADNAYEEILHSNDTAVLELIVAPRSNIENKTAEQVRFKRSLSANLIAVSRQGKPYRGRLKDFRFEVGDLLLLQGERENLEEAAVKLGCLPLAERKILFSASKMSFIAITIFVLAIVTSSLQLIPTHISLAAAVFLMVFLNIVPLKNLYNQIDWPVIILLGAMLPIGNALETTGTTKLISQILLPFGEQTSPQFLLVVILVITMCVSDILNNSATAVLMAPLATELAIELKVNSDAFLMAVAIGASCAFLTPIGHQNNAFVMGPGGYEFKDYWRLGLPLEILIVVIATPLLLWFWPL